MSLLMDALKKAEQAKTKASQDDRAVEVDLDDQPHNTEVALAPAVPLAAQVPQTAQAPQTAPAPQMEVGLTNPSPTVADKSSHSPLQVTTAEQSSPAVEDDLSNLGGLSLEDLSDLDEELDVAVPGSKSEKTLAAQVEPEVSTEDTSLTLELDLDLETENEPAAKRESETPDSESTVVTSTADDKGVESEDESDAAVITTQSTLPVVPVAVDDSYGEEGVSPDSVASELTTDAPIPEKTPNLGTEPSPVVVSSPVEPLRVEAPPLEESQVEKTPKLKTPPVVGVGVNKTSRRTVIWSGLMMGLLLLLGGMTIYFNMVLDSANQRAVIVPVELVDEVVEQPAIVQKTAQENVDHVNQQATIEVAKAPVEVMAKPSVIAMVESSLPTAAIVPRKKSSPVSQSDIVNKQTPTKQAASRAKNNSAAIQITRAQRRDPMEVILQEAYQAYQGGLYQTAEDKYRRALRIDADNRDARLGLAVIAQRTGMVENARSLYRGLLVLNPRDSIALTGLMSLPGNSGSGQNESKIKLLLDEEPTAAHLHFSLGIEFVAQGRWAEAQQSFFQAYRSAPDNADYSYNLAVSLEQLSQPGVALDYYRRAKQLAGGQLVGFDLQQLDQHITRLSAQGEAG